MNLSASWPIWFLVREGTIKSPVTIATIREQTGLSARAIKAAVETLRRKGHAIGACRGRNAGYYEIRTSEEADAAATPMVRQALAMLKTAKAMLPASRYKELLGQAVLGE